MATEPQQSFSNLPNATIPQPPISIPPDSIVSSLAAEDSGSFREFRESLRYKEFHPEVMEAIERQLRDEIRFGSNDASELVCRTKTRLCGTEPLFRSQLVPFLELFADVLHKIVTEQTQNRLASHRVTSSTQSTQNALDTDRLTEMLAQKSNTRAGLTLEAAYSVPQQLERKLAALRSFEAGNPTVGRWFRVLEFTGATVEEIADYYQQQLSEVVEAIDLAVYEIVTPATRDLK